MVKNLFIVPPEVVNNSHLMLGITKPVDREARTHGH